MLSVILIFQNAIYSSANNSSTTPKRVIKNRYSHENSKSNSKDVKIKPDYVLNSFLTSANPDLRCRTPQFSIPERLNANSETENIQKAPLRPREEENPTSNFPHRLPVFKKIYDPSLEKNDENLRKEEEKKNLKLDDDTTRQ